MFRIKIMNQGVNANKIIFAVANRSIEVPHFKPNAIVNIKIRCLLILILSKSKTQPRPPVIVHKSKPIFIDWPNDNPVSITIAGRIEAPGGLRLHLASSIAKSSRWGSRMIFGALTSPFIHCKDDFTCPPMSSPIRTPSPKKGVNETKQITK